MWPQDSLTAFVWATGTRTVCRRHPCSSAYHGNMDSLIQENLDLETYDQSVAADLFCREEPDEEEDEEEEDDGEEDDGNDAGYSE